MKPLLLSLLCWLAMSAVAEPIKPTNMVPDWMTSHIVTNYWGATNRLPEITALKVTEIETNLDWGIGQPAGIFEYAVTSNNYAQVCWGGKTNKFLLRSDLLYVIKVECKTNVFDFTK